MAEHYWDDAALYEIVRRDKKQYKHWFNAASSSIRYFLSGMDFDQLSPLEQAQYFALYWQQFDSYVVKDQPANRLAAHALERSNELLSTLFDEDGTFFEQLND